MSLLVPTIAAFTWSAVQPGWSWRRAAATPATWGAAMDVPDRATTPPPKAADTIDSPGATRSGLRSSDPETGPLELNHASASSFVLAPTVIARREAPGVLIVKYCTS